MTSIQQAKSEKNHLKCNLPVHNAKEGDPSLPSPFGTECNMDQLMEAKFCIFKKAKEKFLTAYPTY